VTGSSGVTGSIKVSNHVDQHQYPVSINLNIAHSDQQVILITINSQSQGQVFQQHEVTQGGSVADDVTITDPQFSFDPQDDWVATITDENGNQIGRSVHLLSDGFTATAHFK
jgi:hypothetical protein